MPDWLIPRPVVPSPHPYAEDYLAIDRDKFAFSDEECKPFGRAMASLTEPKAVWMWIPCTKRDHPRCKLRADAEKARDILQALSGNKLYTTTVFESMRRNMQQQIAGEEGKGVFIPAPPIFRTYRGRKNIETRMRTVISTVDVAGMERAEEGDVYQATCSRPVKDDRRMSSIGCKLNIDRKVRGYEVVHGVRYPQFKRAAEKRYGLHGYSFDNGFAGEEFLAYDMMDLQIALVEMQAERGRGNMGSGGSKLFAFAG